MLQGTNDNAVQYMLLRTLTPCQHGIVQTHEAHNTDVSGKKLLCMQAEHHAKQMPDMHKDKVQLKVLHRSKCYMLPCVAGMWLQALPEPINNHAHLVPLTSASLALTSAPSANRSFTVARLLAS